MTDITIREIQDLRELSEPPAPAPGPAADQEKANGEAVLAEARAMITRLEELGY
jgi:hypothetical protein